MQKFIQWEISLGICNFTAKQKILAGEEFGKAEREKLELQVFRFFHILFISFYFFLKNFKHFQNCPHAIVRKAKNVGVCTKE